MIEYMKCFVKDSMQTVETKKFVPLRRGPEKSAI